MDSTMLSLEEVSEHYFDPKSHIPPARFTARQDGTWPYPPGADTKSCFHAELVDLRANTQVYCVRVVQANVCLGLGLSRGVSGSY